MRLLIRQLRWMGKRLDGAEGCLASPGLVFFVLGIPFSSGVGASWVRGLVLWIHTVRAKRQRALL